MADFDHTDLQHSLPLAMPWERVATKDLCDILHYLSHGLFTNAQDYADRLRNSADAMSEAMDTYTLPNPADYFGAEYLEPFPPPDELP